MPSINHSNQSNQDVQDDTRVCRGSSYLLRTLKKCRSRQIEKAMEDMVQSLEDELARTKAFNSEEVQYRVSITIW